MFVLFSAMFSLAHAQNSVQYTIQAGSDGSASWVIEQTGTDIRVSPDVLAQLQNNLTALIHAAENVTQRQMSARAVSITSTVSGSYVVADYRFLWSNFSVVEGSEIMIGDVFKVPDFFLRLYGDGKIYLTYPEEYSVETVTPPPYNQDASHQTLEWLGTVNLVQSVPTVILKEKPLDFLEALKQNSVAIAGLSTVLAGSSAGVYLFRRRNRKGNVHVSKPETTRLMTENDEEKIVRLLRASGGTLHQTAIVEQTKFSKAKTSQLLTILEKKGTVHREKKGRDKIVTIVEHGSEGKKS